MQWSVTIKSVLLDALAGFLALCMLIAVLVLTHVDNDLRMFLISTAILFLLAGLVRAQSAPTNAWLKGLLVNSAASVIVIIMAVTGMAFTSRGYAALFVLVSLPLVVCGVKTLRLWQVGSRTSALTLSLLSSVAVVLATVLLAPLLTARLSTHSVNQPVPSFSLSTLDGRVVNSSDLKGHVVVLAFWATWCAPCLGELPQVEQVAARYKDNPLVVFWAVDSSWGDDTIDKARAFSAEKRWTVPLAFDTTGAAQVLGVDNLPRLIMLDKTGHMRIVHAGYDASEQLATNISLQIEGLLREP
jgi:thiol-disulfide isomerase/thioredoxin